MTGAYGILPENWPAVCVEAGLPRFRGEQIAAALYRAQIASWDEATTLPAALRATLEEQFPIDTLKVAACSEAGEHVRKFLLACSDGQTIESVFIPQNGRLTVCISTQVGCAFGCAFCASGQIGCVRSLETAEIVGQVMAACRLIREEAAARGEMLRDVPRPNNIVVMGMGEPFANYDNVLAALRILNAPKGLYIGARHITISTCGVVPGILRLADEGVQFELSVSLHAPTDALRSQIMPVNRRWPIEELMAACGTYTEKTGRIVTFEYTLVKQFNDRPSHARQLIELLRGSKARVNLIPLSPVAEFAGETPDPADCQSFQDALVAAGINTTLRRSRGKAGDAACGQLRLRRDAVDIRKGSKA